MRKGVLAVGLVALSLALSDTPLVLSQMQSPSSEPKSQASVEVDSDQLQQEIAMLRAINDMDLSAEQLQTLHAIVSDLRAKRDRVIDAQRSLRAFLVRFEGSRDAYRQAVASHDSELRQARSEFRQALQDAIEEAKGTLTIQQGQILRKHLDRGGDSVGARVAERTRGQRLRPQRQTRRPEGECLTGRLDESLEQLRERVGQMLDRFGLDGPMVEGWKRKWREHVVCPPTPEDAYRSERRVLEQPRLGGPMNVDRLRGLIMDRLDILERVLREKLSAVGGSQA